jgi:hypothetical protein
LSIGFVLKNIIKFANAKNGINSLWVARSLMTVCKLLSDATNLIGNNLIRFQIFYKKNQTMIEQLIDKWYAKPQPSNNMASAKCCFVGDSSSNQFQSASASVPVRN